MPIGINISNNLIKVLNMLNNKDTEHLNFCNPNAEMLIG